jgi:predicted dienelactone hydrolase
MAAIVIAGSLAACGGSRSSSTPTTGPSGATTVADMAAQRFDAPGPYRVGVTTLDLGDRSTEVYYPADPAAVAGKPTATYSTTDLFPAAIRGLIPALMVGTFDTHAVRDATAFAGRAFPLVIYSHGFGGFRNVASFYTSHLASWGFVVASTDHLERGIVAQATGQIAKSGVPTDQDLADVTNTIARLRTENSRSGGLLDGRVDLAHIGITGHSAGAQTAVRAAAANHDISAFISISGGIGLSPLGTLPKLPGLVVAAAGDKVVDPAMSRKLYDGLGSPKYFVEIGNAGHNSFTDSCPLILQRGGLEPLRPLLGALVDLAQNGCTPGVVDPVLVQRALDQYSVAFFLTYLAGTDETAGMTAAAVADLGPLTLSSFEHA